MELGVGGWRYGWWEGKGVEKLVGCRERAWKEKERYANSQEPMKRGQ